MRSGSDFLSSQQQTTAPKEKYYCISCGYDDLFLYIVEAFSIQFRSHFDHISITYCNKSLFSNSSLSVILESLKRITMQEGTLIMASWISKKNRLAIYARDEQVCIYCKKKCIVGDTKDKSINPLDLCTLDHIVSQKELASAATDDADFRMKRRDPKNLVVMCMSCNSSKQDTPVYVHCAQKNLDYAKIIAEISRRISIQI